MKWRKRTKEEVEEKKKKKNEGSGKIMQADVGTHLQYIFLLLFISLYFSSPNAPPQHTFSAAALLPFASSFLPVFETLNNSGARREVIS